jgi:hypothetical protein
MDWYGRQRKIVGAAALPNLRAPRQALAIRFERLEFVVIRLIASPFKPI